MSNASTHNNQRRSSRLEKRRREQSRLEKIDTDRMEVIEDGDPRLSHQQTHLGQFKAERVNSVKGESMFAFYGRPKANGSTEKVESAWMEENGMGQYFQKKLIGHLKKWFNEPVGSPALPEGLPPKPQPVKVLPQQDGSKFYNQGSLRLCTPCAILSALSYIGADKKEQKMNARLAAFQLGRIGADKKMQEKLDRFQLELFGLIAKEKEPSICFIPSILALKEAKGFNIVKPKGLEQTGYDLLKCLPKKLVVAQICAAPYENFNNAHYHDNGHSIVVTRNKIFDANMERPVELSRANLNKCCVGGNRFRFHHVSRAFEFIPTWELMEMCAKVVRKRQLVKRKRQPVERKRQPVKRKRQPVKRKRQPVKRKCQPVKQAQARTFTEKNGQSNAFVFDHTQEFI